MNENQAKRLLKKSALKTTENFTDSLMKQIEAERIIQEQPIFPSIKGVVVIMAVVMLLMSFVIFYTNFKYVLALANISSVSHTKLFVAVLFLVVLGVNHVLKLQHTSTYIFNNSDSAN